jgi:hypothetical protein
LVDPVIDPRWCQQPLGHESDHFNETLSCSKWLAGKAEPTCKQGGCHYKAADGSPFCELNHHNELQAGRKDDAEKPRWDLLPFAGLEQVVKVLTFGAKKYAPENWRRVEGWRWRYFRAAIGHLAAWKAGEKLDPESGLPHLAHAACCVLFLLELDV